MFISEQMMTKLRLSMREQHFPEYIPSTTAKQRPVKRCVVCSKKKIRRETRYMCRDCSVGLCIIPCFKIFHTDMAT